MQSRQITIQGKRYTVSVRDDILDVRGPGVYFSIASNGVAIDSPALRERIVEAIHISREDRARASKNLQASLEADSQ